MSELITKKDPRELIQYLCSHDYGITSLDGEGGTGKVKMVFTLIKRQDLLHLVEIIKLFHPNTFYSVDDVKSVGDGIFPENRLPGTGFFSWIDSLRFYSGKENEVLCSFIKSFLQF